MTEIILPKIPEKERTPLIDMLLHILEQALIQNQKLSKEVTLLKSEVARLKKQSGRPKIKPSKMDKNDDNEGPKWKGGKRPGSSKKSKKGKIKIHETKVIKAKDIPEEAVFKGYRDYDVQDIEINLKNTRYRLEWWQLPDGKYVTAKLPESIKGYHFGPILRSYALQQHHEQLVTQPLLLDQLRAYGVDISTGELDRILNDDKSMFHEEKIEILRTGITNSKYIQVDDTGARHKGKNGYCTQIGNKFFTYFASRRYKSRINFLELLRAGHEDYVFNSAAIKYVKQQRLSEIWLDKLLEGDKNWSNKNEWESYLKKIGLKDKRYIQMLTEGTLLGSIKEHGFMDEITILSDDAGQFNILLHALCWIHAERAITRLIPSCDLQKKAMEQVLDEFWNIYRSLKKYKIIPTNKRKQMIEKLFDALCAKKTNWATLNNALMRLKQNKSELLLVLERPEIPLHNNLSENDIRIYVKKRKISAGTRSDVGRDSRDTFISLKKTCKKVGVSFWKYLNDRISKTNSIPKLAGLVQQAILTNG